MGGCACQSRDGAWSLFSFGNTKGSAFKRGPRSRIRSSSRTTTCTQHHITLHRTLFESHLHKAIVDPYSSETATMQWLISLYCVIMGTVQLYTHLPVGCRFSSLSTCHYGLNVPAAAASNTILLLDAAPLIPIYLSIAPTALEFTATPRTQSITSTSFDRVGHSIYTLPVDIDVEWTPPCRTYQWVRYSSSYLHVSFSRLRC